MHDSHIHAYRVREKERERETYTGSWRTLHTIYSGRTLDEKEQE